MHLISTPKLSDHHWALVLAGGSGTRLSTLTTDAVGRTVPKQYWSLDDGPSLLRLALARGRRYAGAARTTVVVAAEHAAYWQGPLSDVPRQNVVVQHLNRGTAIGILLPLLKILKRDVMARVVLLPSDHYIAREHALDDALTEALAHQNNTITLLGVVPDHADPELGYIVPGDLDCTGAGRVAFFVEKPSAEIAASLIRKGALWNSFIIVADAGALVNLIARRYPETVARMRAVCEGADDVEAWQRLYRDLPNIDLSNDVLSVSVTDLRVAAIADCGWSDLGTPQRVAACLSRVASDPVRGNASMLSLAHAFRQLRSAARSGMNRHAESQLYGELT